MDPLGREEILQVLSDMGIELPPHTKLPDSVLDKRLQMRSMHPEAATASPSYPAQSSLASQDAHCATQNKILVP